jgi:hypothetical protein
MQSILPLSLILAGAGWSPAHAQQFEPRAGLEALDAGATGVFEIGAVDIDQVEAVLHALVHNGKILQVHSKRAGTWLAKRNGSMGGKLIAPTTLDELATIAGGLDTNVRCQPAAVRAQFARVADVVLLDTGAACQPGNSSQRQRHDASSQNAFQIKVERERSTWTFEGYGIVAIWNIPED